MLVALVPGALWRDCVLIASGLLLALNAFFARMDRDSPWDAWRAAIRCGLAGVLSILGGVALLAMAAATMLGAWPPTSHSRDAALLVLAVSIALAVHAGHGLASGGRGQACAGAALVAAAVAESAVDRGVPMAQCVFAIAAALALVWLGWRLAHDMASACLRAELRR